MTSFGYAHEGVFITTLEVGKHLVLGKSFIGYFGPSGDKNFKGNRFPKKKMLESAIASTRRIIAAAIKGKRELSYVEN